MVYKLASATAIRIIPKKPVKNFIITSVPSTEIIKNKALLDRCIELYRQLLNDEIDYHEKTSVNHYNALSDSDIMNMFKTYRQFVLARLENEICGMCCIKKSPNIKTFTISGVVVDPKHRGYGCGKQMCEHAIKAYSNYDINLGVSMANKRAYKMYSSLGFKPTDVRMIRKAN